MGKGEADTSEPHIYRASAQAYTVYNPSRTRMSEWVLPVAEVRPSIGDLSVPARAQLGAFRPCI
jgi:hypothetical protein